MRMNKKTAHWPNRLKRLYEPTRTPGLFFTTQAPWYQRTASHWVMSAKREETRHKRLATLVEDSAQGRTIGPLTRK
ncbi:MAG: YdeI/OmpD-associated family protein [Chloroflexi bacterium]|nr:YdeI/OmpD-associated family protein [Chloroflexota bacterium]